MFGNKLLMLPECQSCSKPGNKDRR